VLSWRSGVEMEVFPYSSQSTNAVKTSHIIEAIEFSLNNTIKKENIEKLNPASP